MMLTVFSTESPPRLLLRVIMADAGLTQGSADSGVGVVDVLVRSIVMSPSTATVITTAGELAARNHRPHIPELNALTSVLEQRCPA